MRVLRLHAREDPRLCRSPAEVGLDEQGRDTGGQEICIQRMPESMGGHSPAFELEKFCLVRGHHDAGDHTFYPGDAEGSPVDCGENVILVGRVL